MGIRERENELFARWADRRPGLVMDGVVDETAYLASSPKILFLLKEVNDQNGGGWDLREYIGAGARPQTWENIARWVKGIRNPDGEIPWDQLSRIEEPDRIETLKSICAINIKKSPGGHTAIARDVVNVAAQDLDFLKEQFALYDPDIVVCCGTGSEIDNIIGAGQWRATSRGISYREIAPRKFAIGYAHPKARVGSSLLYYGLIDAIREIIRHAAIVRIDRRISFKKWASFLDRVREINASTQETRWKFAIEENKIICIRAWLGRPVFEIRFAEARDKDQILYVDIHEVVAHLEHLADHAASSKAIGTEVNLLIDGLIDREE